jgi:hypothetical protein
MISVKNSNRLVMFFFKNKTKNFILMTIKMKENFFYKRIDSVKLMFSIS